MVTIVLLAVLIVMDVMSSRDGQKPTDDDGRMAVTVFLGCAFATSGFWLVRNYVQLGNPFYPWHLPVFDLVGWTNPPDVPPTMYADAEYWWVRAPREWLLYPWLEGLGPERHFGSQTGLGSFFAAAVPVACLASLIGILKNTTRARRTLAILLAGGTALLIAWAAGPRQPRYAMGALVFLVPLVAWVPGQLDRRPRKVFEAVLAISICSTLLVILSRETVGLGRELLHLRHFATRHEAYGYPRMIDRLPPGSTVVNAAARVWNYALFGEGHRNHVVTFEEAIRTMSGGAPPCYYPPRARFAAAHGHRRLAPATPPTSSPRWNRWDRLSRMRTPEKVDRLDSDMHRTLSLSDQRL